MKTPSCRFGSHSCTALRRLGVALLCVFIALPSAWAQQQQEGTPPPGGAQGETSVEDLSAPQEQLYHGVVPGKRDELARATKRRSTRYATLTWIGFQAEQTRTRVFIQSPDKPDYSESISEDGSELTLTFKDAVVENYNLTRFIDASHYERAVKRIDVSSKGKVVRVKLTLSPGVQPTISRKDEYLYIDFPHDGA